MWFLERHSRALVFGQMPALISVRRHGRRVGLHYVVLWRSRNAVLVRTVMHERGATTKVVMRGRRSSGPFERSRFPRVIAGLRTLLHAPEQIDYEDELSANRYKCRISNERVQRNQMVQIGNLSELGIAPRLCCHAEIVHWHEDRICSR